MKALLITLALLAPASGRSLGIGVDVLPEAYTFAAHRVGFAADLRLTTCTTTTCVWDIGDGVTIEAAWPQGSLDIDRIEATLGAPADDADPAAHRFDKACLAIVALVDRDASAADVRAAGKVIASASGDAARPVQIHLPGRWVSVYGLTAATSGGKRSAARRCGATAGL